MSFGQNLQFLRKSAGVTQEELAERLEVSRQSVSKWESDASFPEMDKIIALCDIFGCTMDTLVKGSAEVESAKDSADYDNHMNSFAKSFSAGIFTIISGVSVAGFLDGMGVKEGITGMVFMTFVLAAALTFIVSGINHENFVKSNPSIKPFYKQEKIKAFERKFPVMIAVGIGVIFIGLIVTIGIDELVSNGRETGIAVALEQFIFLFCVAVGASIIVYAGVQEDKYDIEKYNRENSPKEVTEEKREGWSPYQKWYGIIMIVATIIFLVTGIIWQVWEYNWLAFAVGGLLCGIIGIIDQSHKKG